MKISYDFGHATGVIANLNIPHSSLNNHSFVPNGSIYQLQNLIGTKAGGITGKTLEQIF